MTHPVTIPQEIIDLAHQLAVKLYRIDPAEAPERYFLADCEMDNGEVTHYLFSDDHSRLPTIAVAA